MRGLVVVLTVAWVSAIPLALGNEGSLTGGSKLGKEQVVADVRQFSRGKDKASGGYPLVGEHGWGLRFYWVAMQDNYQDEYDQVPIYTREGYFLGVYPEHFLRSLLMEGTGLLSDGRVINYHGSCRFGSGTCYQTLDTAEYPFGIGAGKRALVPFKSVAVDPKFIKIGEPLYIPEFDGLVMPDGSTHDGCVRADDTGGNIRRREMDFFVVSYANFRWILSELDAGIWITPTVEEPRCEYLRQD